MKSNFNDCLQRVLKDEGGYTNDPNDSGGPTKYGITIFDVRKYVKRNATESDVKALTLAQASDIYKSKYWDALSCDSLSSGVDYTCFDYGVNSGLGRPRKALQKFNSLSGTKLITAINNERTAFLKAIGVGKNAGFLRGWLNRVNRVQAYSLELSKKNYSAGAGSFIGLAGIIGYLSTLWHDHPYIIIGGGLGAAAIIGLIVHKLINKGK